MGRGALLIAVVGLVALASAAAVVAGSTERPFSGGPTEGPPVVDCATRSQIVPPRRHPGRVSPRVREASVVAGPVMFLGARQWRDYPTKPRRGIRIPVKVPMMVDAGRVVTVSVDDEARGKALLVVGLDQRPYEVEAREIELRPCPRSAEVANRRVGRRTPFVGGFKLHGPICLGLSVQVEGETDPIAARIPFGRRCQPE